MNKVSLEVLLVVPMPPPLGGNSVHGQRLLDLLTDDGHLVKVLDYTKKNASNDSRIIHLQGDIVTKIVTLLKTAAQLRKSAIVHFHVSALKSFRLVAPLLLLIFRHQPKVITIHSGSFVNRTSGIIDKLLMKLILRFFHKIITVNKEQAWHLERNGIDQHKITTIPAFFPSFADESLVPQQLLEIHSKKQIVLTSGSLTRIYDYDVIIDCIERLDVSRYHFVFAFYGTVDEEVTRHVNRRLSKQHNVTILNNQSPQVFASIVQLCDIYVRSTTHDGDSVAIREALHFGKFVFASDCVERPEGCLVFHQSDSESLYQLFLTPHTFSVKSLDTNNNFAKVLQTYHEVASKND